MMTIEEMEALAWGEEDGCWSKKIGDHWLECIASFDGSFRYRWGVNQVSREVAERVIASAR